MSDLNDKPEVGFDHPRPSLFVALPYAGGKLDLLLRGQQRCLHDLSEVNLNARLRIVSHAPTSPQIVSEATAGFDVPKNTAQALAFSNRRLHVTGEIHAKQFFREPRAIEILRPVEDSTVVVKGRPGIDDGRMSSLESFSDFEYYWIFPPYGRCLVCA
jgi:hypothetical protein